MTDSKPERSIYWKIGNAILIVAGITVGVVALVILFFLTFGMA